MPLGIQVAIAIRMPRPTVAPIMPASMKRIGDPMAHNPRIRPCGQPPMLYRMLPGCAAADLAALEHLHEFNDYSLLSATV